MRPKQRHCRIGCSTETKIVVGQVWPVPDLFRNQTDPLREVFQSPQIRCSVTSSRNLVMPALACQQRPWASLTPARVRGTAFALAIAVMVISPPGRTVGSIDFQHGIDDTERVLNNRVVGATDAVTY